MSAYGAIDENMVARKYETTALYEDPFQYEDSMRHELSDFTPDQATLESDMPRREYQSTSRIHLRESGSRGDNPEHPEIFIGFTDRDPRGIATDPDFKQMANQSWARRRFKEATMYNDDDLSVPSQGIHPNKMRWQIRQSQNELKKRWKIFSTSKDALKPGMSPVSQRIGSEVDKTYAESERMDQHLPSDMVFTQGKTAELSNDTAIGWWQTTDHEFKVAQYGFNNQKMPGRQHEGVKRDTRYEMEFKQSKQAKPSTSMVMLMSAVVSNKKTKHKEGDTNFKEGFESTARKNGHVSTPDELMNLMHQAINQVKYGESKDPITGKRQKVSDSKALQRFVHMTQKLPSHAQLAIKEELERFVKKTPTMTDLHPDRTKVVINPKILTFMDNIIRKTGKTNTDLIGAHMADDIDTDVKTVQTQLNGPTINGIPVFTTKRKTGTATAPSRNGIIKVNGESKKTHSYKHAKPDVFNNPNQQATHDSIMHNSDNNMRRGDLKQARDMMIAKTRVDGDNPFGDNNGLVRHGRKIGGKFQRREMVTDHAEKDMNDM